MIDYLDAAISFLTMIAAATMNATIRPNSMTYPYGRKFADQNY